jgi:hypothetical protein
VVGSIIEVTWLMRLAGKPPRRACSRIVHSISGPTRAGKQPRQPVLLKHSSARYTPEGTVRPSFRTAIKYDPGWNGLELALAYSRIPRSGDRRSHDINGILVASCGRGLFSDRCYVDEFFHLGERQGDGFVSYTPAAYGCGWADDLVGVSGRADTDFADWAEEVLDSIRAYLFQRWVRWTDENVPDLRVSAKRRLNCERRRAFYVSSRFNEELLVFMSSTWPLSLRLVRRPEPSAAKVRINRQKS